MGSRQLLVYGAGGHAKVVAELARALGWEVAAFLEDFDGRDGEAFFGAEVVSWGRFAAGPDRWPGVPVALGVGDNRARARGAEGFRRAGRSVVALVHPSAVVSPTARLGEGTVVLPGAVVNADAEIGAGVVVNTGAVAEHDARVGDFAHLASGSVVGGGASVGAFALIGLGAVVLPRVRVGAGATLGAGAAAVDEVPPEAVAVGTVRTLAGGVLSAAAGGGGGGGIGPGGGGTVAPGGPADAAGTAAGGGAAGGARGGTDVVTFVIPVYRNRGTIRTTYERVVAMLRESFPGLGYQFVLVDDGSDDGSLDEILEVRRGDPAVEAVALSRNFGQVAATVAGLRHARGDAAVVLSADLQDPVALIADMIREWRAGTQVVVCYRVAREDSPAAVLASKVFYGLVRLSNPAMPSGGFDFVLLDRRPYRVLAALRDRNRFFQGDVLWLGFPTKLIPYERARRTVGRSQWTLSKKLKYFIDGLLNTSYLPIRFMSLIGILTSLSGFLYALVVVYVRLTNRQPYIGYAPVMIVLLCTSGVVMTMLGVIGEYLWRIYDETRARPIYLVREHFPPRSVFPGAGTAPDPPAG